jgi:hypothetical protein
VKIVYQCDNCTATTPHKEWIFPCIFCGKEICESCMDGSATCRECAATKTEEEIEKAFEERP